MVNRGRNHTTILQCWQKDLLVIGVDFPPNIALLIVTKKVHFEFMTREQNSEELDSVFIHDGELMLTSFAL